MNISQLLTKLKTLVYSKSETDSLLGGKASSSHTHTKSQITDFPTIPSKVSQLTNDSGFITSSGSCNYANSAGSASSATTATTAGAVRTVVDNGSSKDLVYATMANNDYCRISCGGSDDAGYLEIATGDGASEPIYVRQYPWESNASPRTLTLLDGSGNTQFPGTVTAPTFSGNLNGNCSGSAGSVAWGNVSGKPSTFTPSSHTHTKSQITDFPAYGNTAGTICQGNDPRLSDARTPYFANGTWYAVGDDAAIGDHNVGGGLGVKALNSTTTRIDLCYKDDASNYKSITYDGTTLYMNGNCNYATSAGSAGSASSATTAGAVSTSVAAGSTKNLVYASMADNDQCRIMCGGSSNAGYMEIATSDDGNEPIYVRQYNNGTFGSVVRTLTLLDGSGNTILPGRISLQGSYQVYVG